MQPHEQITHERVDSIDVVSLNGSFDTKSSFDLDNCLKSLIQEGTQKLLIDLTLVSYLVSTAFRAIINAQVRLRLVQGQLFVVCPLSNHVRRTLRLSQLDQVITLYESKELAIAKFQ